MGHVKLVKGYNIAIINAQCRNRGTRSLYEFSKARPCFNFTSIGCNRSSFLKIFEGPPLLAFQSLGALVIRPMLMQHPLTFYTFAV